LLLLLFALISVLLPRPGVALFWACSTQALVAGARTEFLSIFIRFPADPAIGICVDA
jgi:hypothetical protein